MDLTPLSSSLHRITRGPDPIDSHPHVTPKEECPRLRFGLGLGVLHTTTLVWFSVAWGDSESGDARMDEMYGQRVVQWGFP